MLTQSNEIGQLQTQFLLNERELKKTRNGINKKTDAMQNQIDSIKKNYSILVEQNPDFLLGKRPEWYKEDERIDVDTGWAVADSDPRENVMCFGGNITVPNTISYKNYNGEIIDNDFYLPIYMIINRYDGYWSNPIYYMGEMSENPFAVRKTQTKTVAQLLYGLFDANSDDGVHWNRFDLSNIHDFYIYRFFEFALGGL